MRVRTYGLLLLVLVGVIPLVSFGYLGTKRAQRTAIREVRSGNLRIARSVAERVQAYALFERALIAEVSAAALQATDRQSAQRMVNSHQLRNKHVQKLFVYRSDGSLWVGTEAKPRPEFIALANRALEGEHAHSAVEAAKDNPTGLFAHTILFAEPVHIAGGRDGAVVARIDLVGVWDAIADIHIGETGYVRLLSPDGVLIAHGHPEEGRFVYREDADKDARLVSAALLGVTGQNQQGIEVVAAAEFIPGLNWIVLVDQEVAEAYAGTSTMRRDLAVFGGVALFVALILGVLFGRVVVKGLERLRTHTRVLAKGRLDLRVRDRSGVQEIRVLAESLNEMASSLKSLQDEAAARERLTMFSRVAAGLAHDLRHPVESLRMACETFLESPDDANDQAVLERIARRDVPRLSRFVDDLRNLAKRGELELERTSVDLDRIVESVLSEAAVSPKWRGVHFRAEGIARECALDVELVRRAVTNLVGNAADAVVELGPPGEVVVTLENLSSEEVVIRVRDTGTGISPERLLKIANSDFESSKRSTGFGLGLGVVRHVAHVHGGRLEVESTVGKGSTFSLMLSCPALQALMQGVDDGRGTPCIQTA